MATKREGIFVTAIYRRNKYGNKTISIVFINASFNPFRMKILWIKKTCNWCCFFDKHIIVPMNNAGGRLKGEKFKQTNACPVSRNHGESHKTLSKVDRP